MWFLSMEIAFKPHNTMHMKTEFIAFLQKLSLLYHKSIIMGILEFLFIPRVITFRD